MFLYAFTDPVSGHAAAIPFAERHWQGTIDIYTPAGFSGFVSNGPTPGLMTDWESFASDRGYVCGYFALHPVVSVSALHKGLVSRNELFVVDLRRGFDESVESFDADTKRRLRKWKADGVRVVSDRAGLTAYLVENYQGFMKEMNASGGTIWPQSTLEAICSDTNVHLVGAADDQGICCASLFGLTPYCAEYLASVRSRDGKRLAPLLMESAVGHLCAQGVPWLNLGGGISPNDAVAKSKLRYGSLGKPFVAAREVYRHADYDRLVVASGPAAHVDGNYFPSYRHHYRLEATRTLQP